MIDDDDWFIWAKVFTDDDRCKKEKKNPENSTFTDKSLRTDEKNNKVLLSIMLEGPQINDRKAELFWEAISQLSNHLEKTVFGGLGVSRGGVYCLAAWWTNFIKGNDQINGLILLMGTLTIVMQNKCTEVCWWNGSKAAAVWFQSMHYTSLCIKRKPTALWCFFIFFCMMIILY